MPSTRSSIRQRGQWTEKRRLTAASGEASPATPDWWWAQSGCRSGRVEVLLQGEGDDRCALGIADLDLVDRAGRRRASTTAMTAGRVALLTGCVGVVKPPRRGSTGVGEAGIRVPTEAGTLESCTSLAQKIWEKILSNPFAYYSIIRTTAFAGLPSRACRRHLLWASRTRRRNRSEPMSTTSSRRWSRRSPSAATGELPVCCACLGACIACCGCWLNSIERHSTGGRNVSCFIHCRENGGV
jgi:hypothetical protein